MFLGHNISAPISQRWVSAFLIKRFRESNISFDFQFVTKGESDLRLEWVANGDLSSGRKGESLVLQRHSNTQNQGLECIIAAYTLTQA
jgi:hypothetical protein